MRVGELAKRTGLSRDTIRFYERAGLIASVPSTEASNAYRDYPDELIDRLAMIGAARAVGFSIADLFELIKSLERPADFDADPFLDQKITQLSSVIAKAQKLRTLLKATRASLAAGPIEWRS